MNKIYWYENSCKLMGTLIQHNNHILLTAQNKFKLQNVIDIDCLQDMGISFYCFSKLIPENVTYYNLKDGLRTITDMSIAGFFISKIDILSTKNEYFNNELLKYDLIIKKSLNILDLSFVDTTKTRILYSYFNNLNNIKSNYITYNIDLNLIVYTLLNTYYNFINFAISTVDFTLIDCIFLQYCLNDYLKICKNINISLIQKEELMSKLILSLKIIDNLLLAKNNDEYISIINNLHNILKEIKSIIILQNTPKLLNKHILKPDTNTENFLNQFNPYLLKKINKINNKLSKIKNIDELTDNDTSQVIYNAYKKKSIYEEPLLLNTERSEYIANLMKKNIDLEKIKTIFKDNKINLGDDYFDNRK